MKSKRPNPLIAYSNAYFLPSHSKVHIYPKILSEKSDFSEEEKNNLMKSGLRWYIYYDFRNPETAKMERQPPITEGINREFQEKENFDAKRRRIFTMRDSLDVINFIITDEA